MVAYDNDMKGLEATGTLLREVARLHVRAQREQAACCGATATQCQILTELGRTEALPITELGWRLGLHKGWISRAVAGLVDEGLVLRAGVDDDGRVVTVSLSLAGRRRLRALNRTLDRQAARVLSNVPRPDRAQVHRALEMVRSALRRELGLTKTPAGGERIGRDRA